MKTSSPDISVLFVTFNGRDEVLRSLRSLFDSGAVASFEVLLIDNASVDGTAKAVRDRFPCVQVIELPVNVGYGSAMNILAKEAQGSYLMFLNPDTVLTENSLDKLYTFAESESRLGVLSPRLIYGDGTPQASARRFPSPARLWLEVSRVHLLLSPARRGEVLSGTYFAQDVTQEVDWTSGACHFIPRATWEAVGPLTEDTFCGFDDLEYCMRTRAAGFVNWFYAGTEITHHCSASVNARWNRRQVAYLAINNMGVVLTQHWGFLKRKNFFAAETFGALTDVMLSAATRRRGSGESAVAYRRAAMERVRILAALLLSVRQPVRRCEPQS